MRTFFSLCLLFTACGEDVRTKPPENSPPQVDASELQRLQNVVKAQDKVISAQDALIKTYENMLKNCGDPI
jgi:hypothetical protein